MRPEVTKLRSNYQSKRANKKLYPKDVCSRCGMHVSEHKHKWGKGGLQLHHIKSITQCVDEGILDPQVVNGEANMDSLCTFCHKEWHMYAEALGLQSYEEWKRTESVLDRMGRVSCGTTLDTQREKFTRKAR